MKPDLLGTDSLCDKARQVHDRLCVEYRCPIGYFDSLDPLSELV